MAPEGAIASISSSSEVGLGASDENSLWLRLRPIPTMLPAKLAPLMECSMSIPQIFLFPIYISLGHFICAGSPLLQRYLHTPMAATSEMANCWAGERNVGLKSIENVRFSHFALSHLLPLWPLPAVWKSAIHTVPSGAWDISLAAWVLVESKVWYHFMSTFLRIIIIGRIFAVSLQSKINDLHLKFKESGY